MCVHVLGRDTHAGGVTWHADDLAFDKRSCRRPLCIAMLVLCAVPLVVLEGLLRGLLQLLFAAVVFPFVSCCPRPRRKFHRLIVVSLLV